MGIRDRLRDKLTGTSPRAALEDHAQASPRTEEKREAQYADTDVYLVTDGTRSMEGPIDVVAKGMEQIGKELFQHPERGAIRIAAWGVYDHNFDHLLRPFELTSSLSTLVTHIRALQDLETNRQQGSGADHAEGYECAWLALAREISRDAQSRRKKVAVFMGDMLPHGFFKKSQRVVPIYIQALALLAAVDNGCPHDVDYRLAWQALTTAADLTLFVGCSEHRGSPYRGSQVSSFQRSIVKENDPKQKFVALENVGDISTLIMGATRLAQSSAAYNAYLKGLPAPQAAVVRGYLGGPTK